MKGISFYGLLLAVICLASQSMAQNGGLILNRVSSNDVLVGDINNAHTEINSTHITLYPLTDSDILELPGAVLGSIVYAANAENIVIYDGDSWNNVDGTLYLEVFYCGYEQLIDSRDLKEYNTVKIGDQCWMAENLNIGSLVASTEAGDFQTDNSIVEKYCFNNLEANCDTYGGLYQWRELMNYSYTSGGQGICPAGWHVPSSGEWNTLQSYLINNGFGYGGSGDDIAKSLADKTSWDNDETPGHIGNDPMTNNQSGFSALGTGFRWTDDGSFQHFNSATYFWTSTSNDNFFASRRRLHYDESVVVTLSSRHLYGFSVRCVLD